VKEGRVRLEVWKKGADPEKDSRLDYYEAWVVPLKKIEFRVNLLSGKTAGVATKVTAPQAADHIKIANIYLRQVGITLVADTDTTEYDEAKKVNGMPGYFAATADDDLVRTVTKSDSEKTIQINDNKNVTQIIYIQSLKANAYGVAPSRPGNSFGDKYGSTVDLTFRINNGADSEKHTMKLLGAEFASGPNTWGTIITNANGDPLSNRQKFANTIAHEIGHVMGLAHRGDPVGDFTDGLSEPGNKNLMSIYAGLTNPADLDLIQLRASRGSKALK
jgi:hypothetical protein